MFQEAYNHSRCPKVVKQFVQTIDVATYQSRSFEEILSDIILRRIRGVGWLACYDIASAIAKHYNQPITKVYLMGDGPVRAIQLLQLWLHVQKVKLGNLMVPYIQIDTLCHRLREQNIEFNTRWQETQDGNELENWLCNWQKTQPKHEVEVVCINSNKNKHMRSLSF